MNPPKSSSRRFVVAGCSRSGTTYMAKLLSTLGYSCGHERIFNVWRIFGIQGFSDPMTNFCETDAKQGDASFLSIPYLDQLPEETVVLHQVRSPLQVIRSHMGIRFFADPYVPSIYLAKEHPQILHFVGNHCPEILAGKTEILRCMRYWYYWNRSAERAKSNPSLRYVHYRIEDLNMDLLQRILRALDAEFIEERCSRALQSLRKDTNTRPRDTSWTWTNLPPGPEKDQVTELADQYGYPAD